MPTQKEVIHLTFGTLPHHITTHFFNQQSSHFDYSLGGRETDDDKASALVLDPNVDFQEGIGAQSSQPTFFPRQVVVDFRQNIGTKWDAYDVVFEEDDQGYETTKGILQPGRAAEEGWNAWDGPAQVQRTGGQSRVSSTRIANARFDDEQDEEDSADEEEDEGREDTSQQHQSTSEARQKRNRLISRDVTPAEYARNPAHPRSVRPLPALYGSGALVPMDAANSPDSDACPFSTFEMGIGMARYMERQESLFDEQIRWLAEDSDQMQSFALYASTFDGFSGMAHETLELLKDEYPKVNIMAWGADLDEQRFKTQDEDERNQLIRMTNRVLSLWSLSSASIYTPLGVPESLVQPAKKTGPEYPHYSRRADWTNMYNVGALYAAHIDTITMPCRLFEEGSRRTLPNLASALNWRLNTPIATLGGCLPTPLLAPIEVEAKVPFDPIMALLAARGYDADRAKRSQHARPLSSEERAKQAAQSIQKSFVDLTSSSTASSRKVPMDSPFGQAVVARDDDREALVPTRDALEQWTSLDEPTACIDVVPLSFSVRAAAFPQLFRNVTSNGRPLPQPSEDRKTRRVDRMPTLASLTTTPYTTSLLDEARRWIDQTMIKGHQPLTSFGIGGSRGRSAAGQAANDETEGYLGGREGLMEVRERLEELLGAYEEGLGSTQAHLQYEDEQDRVGTDEETPNQGDDSDWDLE